MEQGLSSSTHQQNEYSTNSYKGHSEADTDSEPVFIKGVPQEPARPPPHLNSEMFETCGGGHRSNSRPSSRSGSRHRLHDTRGSQNSLSLPRARSRGELSPRLVHGEVPTPRQRTPDNFSRIEESDHEMYDRRDSTRRYDSQRPHQPMRSPRNPGPIDESYHSYGRRPSDGGRSYDSQNIRKMGQPNGQLSNYSINENGYYSDHMSPRTHQSPRPMDESIYRTPRRLKHPDDGGSNDSGVQHMTCNFQSLS